MDHASLIFCVMSLVASLVISAIAYPFAALSPDAMTAWRTPAEAESMEALDLGDFGVVSPTELVDYYMENPPAPPAAGAVSEREVRFQGC